MTFIMFSFFPILFLFFQLALKTGSFSFSPEIQIISTRKSSGLLYDGRLSELYEFGRNCGKAGRRQRLSPYMNQGNTDLLSLYICKIMERMNERLMHYTESKGRVHKHQSVSEEDLVCLEHEFRKPVGGCS